MIIYLNPAFAEPPGEFSFVVMRRYPRINGPAVLPLFCLAPHGVFRASRITPRAVSSYLAFSPLPALLSKNRRCLFCDTFRHRNFSTAAPTSSTWHAAVWCSDFPPAPNAFGASDHLPSAVILAHFGLAAAAGLIAISHRFQS